MSVGVACSSQLLDFKILLTAFPLKNINRSVIQHKSSKDHNCLESGHPTGG